MKIRAENLKHIYDEGSPFERIAVDDINTSFNSGEFIGIVGKTGSGKSSFILHLNGLLKPVSGRLLVDDEDVWANGYPIKELRRRVGLVFQYPEHQLFEENVFADVCFGPRNLGLSKTEIDERAADALRLVGLGEETWKKSPFELSGGQKRRAAIAGVLAMRPEVLVLDEPAAGLDPAGRNSILSAVSDIQSQTGAAIVLVSHNMEDVSKFCKRIIIMGNGRILAEGAPKEIFDDSVLLETAGLLPPPAAVIMSKLRAAGLDLPKGIFTVKDAARVLLEYASKCAV